MSAYRDVYVTLSFLTMCLPSSVADMYIELLNSEGCSPSTIRTMVNRESASLERVLSKDYETFFSDRLSANNSQHFKMMQDRTVFWGMSPKNSQHFMITLFW